MDPNTAIETAKWVGPNLTLWIGPEDVCSPEYSLLPLLVAPLPGPVVPRSPEAESDAAHKGAMSRAAGEVVRCDSAWRAPALLMPAGVADRVGGERLRRTGDRFLNYSCFFFLVRLDHTAYMILTIWLQSVTSVVSSLNSYGY